MQRELDCERACNCALLQTGTTMEERVVTDEGVPGAAAAAKVGPVPRMLTFLKQSVVK